MYLERIFWVHGMSGLSPESVPEPLKNFFEHGILTPEQVSIYKEYGYGRANADDLFMKKYAELHRRGENIVLTEEFLKNIVVYEAWVTVHPTYNDMGSLVSLMVVGTVRAVLKSGLYVEISEIAYSSMGYRSHEIEYDVGRL